jgi:hypothetical protein
MSKQKTKKRVREALTKYVRSQVKNPRVKLAKNWTPAKVRVNSKGEVQIAVNPCQNGGRTIKNVKSVKVNSAARRKRKMLKKTWTGEYFGLSPKGGYYPGRRSRSRGTWKGSGLKPTRRKR